MNKLFSIFLIIVLAISLSSCGSSDKGTEGLEYEAWDGVYWVVGYHGDDINVVIPDTYNGVPVKYINEYCFEGSEIQSVKIGNNVEEILEGAFYACSLLKEVSIPASVKIIYAGESTFVIDGAFESCVSLEKVVFDRNSQLEKISADAFRYCENLKEINLPETLTRIGPSVFSGCTSLKEISIPASVTDCGKFAFYEFTADQTIIICGSTAGWDFDWDEYCEASIIYK